MGPDRLFARPSGMLGKRLWRLRRWIVGYVLLALLLPGATLPLEVFGDELHHLVAHQDGDEVRHTALHSHQATHRHHDFSDVPGSPTHPLDHNCFECQVLQHLARCIPTLAPLAIAPALPACLVVQSVAPTIAPHRFTAPRPPSCGPPAFLA